MPIQEAIDLIEEVGAPASSEKEVVLIYLQRPGLLLRKIEQLGKHLGMKIEMREVKQEVNDFLRWSWNQLESDETPL